MGKQREAYIKLYYLLNPEVWNVTAQNSLGLCTILDKS